MNGSSPSEMVRSDWRRAVESPYPNLGTVKSRLNRARNRLARDLRDYRDTRIAGAGTASPGAPS